MKLLITGTTGFVGRHLVKELEKNPDYEILSVSRDIVRAKQLFDNKRIQYCTISDRNLITAFNADVVIHLASKLTSSNSTKILDDLIDSNIRYGVHLLDTLKNCSGLKLFLNFGTSAEYRLGADKVNNAYLYSTTKSAFRVFLDYYSELCGYKYLHIVPFTIYGGESSQKKIIDLIKDSLNSDEPQKMSAGEQILDFIHVDDVANFVIFLLNNTARTELLHNGETLFLGTGKGTSLRQLATEIEKAAQSRCNIVWGARPYRDRDIMHAVAPIGKLIDMGWRPSISLKNFLASDFLNHSK